MRAASPDLLTGLLREVSRSFYLTLRALPRAIRPQIGLAYLLARASDTIADTDAVPVGNRIQALDQFQKAAASGAEDFPMMGLAGHQASPSEKFLLERLPEALELLNRTPTADRARIQKVLGTIIGGQRLDLERFGTAAPDRIVALRSDRELDDYTYRVAGSVGEFWTEVCQAHLFPQLTEDTGRLLERGVRFGKGLQLTNILRDLPRDLRIGRCYLPEDRLGRMGLAPGDLLDPSYEARLRPLYEEYLACAEEHLEAGWAYTNMLPRKLLRLRLACAWPILIGIRTLACLRTQPVLDPDKRVKVSRREVRQILLRSLLAVPFRRRWDNLFERARFR
jgi:farnesyl-diphosphate farnesyltransferase